MAIQFVPEDGTGILGANAFCDLAFASQFHENEGTLAAWAALASDDVRKSSLVVATTYLSSGYQWIGSPYNLVAGYLAWPRWGAYDAAGVLYAGVPDLVKRATAWLALQHNTTRLDKPFDAARDLKSVAITGSLDITWNEGASAAAAPRYGYVDQLLAPLMLSGIASGSFGMGRIVRG